MEESGGWKGSRHFDAGYSGDYAGIEQETWWHGMSYAGLCKKIGDFKEFLTILSEFCVENAGKITNLANIVDISQKFLQILFKV
jgi:hypothetical protein